MFLKLAEDNTVEEFSLNEVNVRKLFPNVSFPINLPYQYQIGQYIKYSKTSKPSANTDQKVVEVTPIKQNGAWIQQWEVQNLPSDTVISRLKEKKKTEVAAELSMRINGDVYHENNAFQLGNGGRKNMSDTLSVISSGIANAHGGYWRSKDNTKVPFNDQEVISLFVSAYAYGANCIRHSHDLKDQINNANTVSAVETINVSGGWPNNQIG
jgi:hypothetical protein